MKKFKSDTALSESKIMKVLDYAYDKALNGVPGVDSSYDMAENYNKQTGELIDRVNSLIRWQNTKAASTGFLTGLGGILTLPVAIPANLATVWYVQIRMIVAIAIMGGYEVKDDRVKTLVYACLTGTAASDVLKNTGIVLGTKFSTQFVKSISGETIKAINKAVGFRLLTKFGQKGIVNLGKAVPIVGGIIGASFDGISTNIIGNIARDTFISSKTFSNDVDEEKTINI